MKLIRHLSFKLAAVLSSAVVLAACQNAQSHSRFAETSQATMVQDTTGGGTNRSSPGMEGGGMPEGIGRSGGRYYYIRNGQATRLTQPQRFAQGTSYDGKGRIVLFDGNIARLNEGEMVTFAGQHLDLPPGTAFSAPTPRPQ